MSNKQVLLVEDNPDDQELTVLALNKIDQHLDIIIANDGEQAISMILGEGMSAITPDLVLLDLKLPKVNGIEVLKTIRANHATKYLPVVILTTSNEDSDIAHSYDNGANSYIRKPVNFEDFVSRIGYVVDYWFTCNQMS